MTRAVCSSCGAPIVWCRTLTGKRMPVDVEADPVKGNVLITEAVHGRESGLMAITLSALNQDARDAAKKHGVVLRTSHFATCPNADQHRR